MRALYQAGYGQQILTVLDSRDNPVFFNIQRNKMLNWQEVIQGKITQYNETLRGYFIETSKKLPVFVPTMKKFSQGETVFIQITKEARLGKEATGRIWVQDTKESMPPIGCDLSSDIVIETDVDNKTDLLLEEALNRCVLFADGAELHIERTQSCWTIDIDSGTSHLTLADINKQACIIIYQQIRLKNLSGVILIDFAGYKDFQERQDLFHSMKETFVSDNRSTLYGFTKTRLFELKRQRTTASLEDLFLMPNGKKNPHGLVPIIMRQILSSGNGKLLLKIHPSLLAVLPSNIYTYCSVETDLNVPEDYYELKGK